MAKATVSMRIETELWEWLAGYAKARGASRTAVIEAAVRSLREDAGGGVPELEQAPAITPVPQSVSARAERGQTEVAQDRPDAGATAPQRASGSASARVPVRKKVVLAPPPFARPMGAMERQRKLNEAKERSK